MMEQQHYVKLKTMSLKAWKKGILKKYVTNSVKKGTLKNYVTNSVKKINNIHNN